MSVHVHAGQLAPCVPCLEIVVLLDGIPERLQLLCVQGLFAQHLIVNILAEIDLVWCVDEPVALKHLRQILLLWNPCHAPSTDTSAAQVAATCLAQIFDFVLLAASRLTEG